MDHKEKEIDEEVARRLELKRKSESADRKRAEKWKIGNKKFP